MAHATWSFLFIKLPLMNSHASWHWGHLPIWHMSVIIVLLTRKIDTPTSRAPLTKLRLQLLQNRGMPVNLTCKLIRNQQTLNSRAYRLDFRITLTKCIGNGRRYRKWQNDWDRLVLNAICRNRHNAADARDNESARSNRHAHRAMQKLRTCSFKQSYTQNKSNRLYRI